MAWIINDGEYPTQEIWDEDLTYPVIPYPNGFFTTDNGYPEITSLTPIEDVPVIPMPNGVFLIVGNSYPKYYLGNEKLFFGAFNNTRISNIKVEHCTSIGRYAFRNTNITSITLPANCTYYSTSFPLNCVVTGGQLIND